MRQVLAVGFDGGWAGACLVKEDRCIQLCPDSTQLPESFEEFEIIFWHQQARPLNALAKVPEEHREKLVVIEEFNTTRAEEAKAYGIGEWLGLTKGMASGVLKAYLNDFMQYGRLPKREKRPSGPEE